MGCWHFQYPAVFARCGLRLNGPKLPNLVCGSLHDFWNAFVWSKSSPRLVRLLKGNASFDTSAPASRDYSGQRPSGRPGVWRRGVAGWVCTGTQPACDSDQSPGRPSPVSHPRAPAKCRSRRCRCLVPLGRYSISGAISTRDSFLRYTAVRSSQRHSGRRVPLGRYSIVGKMDATGPLPWMERDGHIQAGIGSRAVKTGS